MLRALVVWAVLAAPAVVAAQSRSAYASPALEEFVARAAQANGSVPAELKSYRARLETEVAMLRRDATGREVAFGIEQMASDLTWAADGSLVQRVVGHRGDAGLLPFSAGKHAPWAVPVLYGDSIFLRIGADDTPRIVGLSRYVASLFRATHPFVPDRDSVYRFTGGDTVARLTMNGRLVTLVRVHVEPRADVKGPRVVFSGDVDCDAERGVIAHVRGYFREVGFERTPRDRALRELAFAEIITAEHAGNFWLPVYERYELAVITQSSDRDRVVRVTTRFSDHQINVATPFGRFPLPASRFPPSASRSLVWAVDDSLEAFSQWTRPPGAETRSASAADFSDVAPPDMRPTGKPQFSFRVPNFGQRYHVNRVEGLYTGVGGALMLRDRAPGVTLRGHAGWAWSEQIVRGAAEVEKVAAPWIVRVRGGRLLVSMTDFVGTAGAGSAIDAVSGVDLDYLDRRGATLEIERAFSSADARVRMATGPGGDLSEVPHVLRGPDPDTTEWMVPATRGNYWRSALAFFLHGSVLESSAANGVGFGASATRGAAFGTRPMSWNRAEAAIVARRRLGRTHAVRVAARVDGGAVNAAAPVQQLFDVGGRGTLDSYSRGRFSGDRAWIARASVAYAFPLPETRGWLARVPRSLFSVTPTVEAGVASVTASTAAAATLDAAYGTHLWSVTGSARGSVTAGVRFLGGGLLAGATRPIDQAGPWRFVLRAGRIW